ncbi:hypothetical protein BST99_04390 [Aureicoccus marinus]|uniref:Uncharacterized protein n=2 Tax=Aureicoccus marinus TaxID=754435 RepID=A0A2S7T572_9FLAO|nr:hypothetical protein BST99_04390 [Aureicoccus marinus]
MVLTLINGHEITHLFDGDDSCDEICLVCQVQENQQEEAFLLPSQDQVKEPLRTLVHLEPAVLLLTQTASSFKERPNSRPPPFL